MKTSVHAARIACKKARAALKLIQTAKPRRYARENAAIRDAARLLSPLRDADAVRDSMHLLLSAGEHPLGPRQVAALRRAVAAAQREHRLKPADVHRCLAGFVTSVQAALKRWRESEFKGLKNDDILRSYRQTYRRCRRALQLARERNDTASFHEWRKVVKAHGYQSRLLCCASPPLLKKQSKLLARLGRLLGDDHDLAVLRSGLEARSGAHADSDVLGSISHRIHERSDSLRAEALQLGSRLFARKPGAVERRMRRRWRRAAPQRA